MDSIVKKFKTTLHDKVINIYNNEIPKVIRKLYR